MKHWLNNNLPAVRVTIIKILITAILYYLTSLLGNLLIFTDLFAHDRYPPYWPPSGVAFSLIIIFGRSAWPGIAIASFLLLPESYWLLGNSYEFIDFFFVILFFSVGRILEPLVGHYLLQRFSIDDPFKNPRNAIYFIIITFFISLIGASISSSSIQFFRNDSIEVYFMRTLAWYVDNVVGILIFAPFFIGLHYLIKNTINLKSTTKALFVIMALGGVCYFIKGEISSLSLIILNSLPFLIIPVFLWLAFNYHLTVSSFAVIMVSIITVYFTTQGMGPFVEVGDWQNSVWLLQSFLVVASISNIVSFSASNDRMVTRNQLALQATELQKSNQNLVEMMEFLHAARSKAEESDRLKSTFLANMSHEIRTPMNAIMGFSELLSRSNLSTEKRHEFTDLIQHRTQDLLTIVNDILDISKIESGQMSYAPVSGNLQDLFDRLQTAYAAEAKHLQNKSLDIRMFNELNGAENMIFADFVRLHQVLNNLINNAMKFTQQGVIEFGCRLQDSKTLLVTVRDTGMGIEPEKIKMIFKPFYQVNANMNSRFGGTGLGLAIVTGLVKLWGGEIWVESEVGQGSVFSFTLPYRTADNEISHR